MWGGASFRRAACLAAWLGGALRKGPQTVARCGWAPGRCVLQPCVLRLHNRLPQEFLGHWGSDIAAETAGAAPCPNSLLYTSWVTATAHERAFYEGVWAQLLHVLLLLRML